MEKQKQKEKYRVTYKSAKPVENGLMKNKPKPVLFQKWLK